MSTCDGPPFMNRKMTRLALAGKCGGLGAIGSAGTTPSAADAPVASRPASAKAPARPSAPNPPPILPIASRRVMRGPIERFMAPPGIRNSRFEISNL